MQTKAHLESAAVDCLRDRLAQESVATDLHFAAFYFLKCKEHFEESAKLASEELPDRSAFVYAMQ
jgi:hypothetical protein